EIVINDDVEEVTADKKFKLVYDNQTLKMELRKNNGDTINAANIQWKINKNIVDSTLVNEITIANKDVEVTICEKYINEKGKEKKADIAKFTFVVKKSPYVLLSTPNDYDGEFGFDNTENLKNDFILKESGQYETIQIINDKNKAETLYVPYLTILKGNQAELKVKLSEKIEGDNIYVVADDGLKPEYYREQDKLIISIKNNFSDNSFDDPAYVSFYRADKYCLQEEKLIGRCAVVSKPQIKQVDVQIIYFASNLENPANKIDVSTLENLLNLNSLNQAFVQFDVLENKILIENKLNITETSTFDNIYSDVLKACIGDIGGGNSVKTNQNPDKIYVVVTDIPVIQSDGLITFGGVYRKNNFAVMLWDNVTEGDKYKAIIHEIGHSLGLDDMYLDVDFGGDPFVKEVPKTSFTKSNYMDYNVEKRNMFFKIQIEKIIRNIK
ncbi:MAG: hypothetical protein LBR45_00170, partial [Bacteroidales bacterium]|nr:hypothetical protein [Bacteroidales bacterium]